MWKLFCVVAAGSSFLCSRIIFKYSNHANYWNYFKGKLWVFKVGFIMLGIIHIHTILYKYKHMWLVLRQLISQGNTNSVLFYIIGIETFLTQEKEIGFVRTPCKDLSLNENTWCVHSLSVFTVHKMIEISSSYTVRTLL